MSYHCKTLPQGPEQVESVPIFWFHIPNAATVSFTSNRISENMESYLDPLYSLLGRLVCQADALAEIPAGSQAMGFEAAPFEAGGWRSGCRVQMSYACRLMGLSRSELLSLLIFGVTQKSQSGGLQVGLEA